MYVYQRYTTLALMFMQNCIQLKPSCVFMDIFLTGREYEALWKLESPRSAFLYPLKTCMDSMMTNRSQFSHSVTDLPNVSQIPCDTLEEHKVCSALCLWVHCLLARYTSSQKCSSIPRSTGGRRTGAVSLPLLYTDFFFPRPEQFLITG